jgi:16S rRNA (guanine966-N2)-methyltransferase
VYFRYATWLGRSLRPYSKLWQGFTQGTDLQRAARKQRPDGGNSLRIIGGVWRGRRIRFPDLPSLRPTPDRVRETLFNWLQNEIAGVRCADLFAGSGAIGIEALSRGARAVTFVEHDRTAADGIVASVAILGGSAGAHVLHTNVAQFLAGMVDPFDIIFLDPPFGRNLLAKTLKLLAERGWLREGGLVYLECERESGEPALPAGWQRLKAKYAGEVGYHLARHSPRNPL